MEYGHPRHGAASGAGGRGNEVTDVEGRCCGEAGAYQRRKRDKKLNMGLVEFGLLGSISKSRVLLPLHGATKRCYVSGSQKESRQVRSNTAFHLHC